ncbi:MAG: ABC transporter ATP-binding protein [Lentisphaeria bacterium]|nr:ABC transporter ATP-binding protein [Lentisphaeria bacterium]
MSSEDIVLSVRNVSKCFEMYEKPVHRLFQTLCAGYRKFYKDFWALKDIDFEVRKGECIGIIGRNGAGKSTLLQIITGTLQQTTGTVSSKGRIAALLELGSGFNPEFTGRENVYMNASILGLSTEEIDRKYQSILDFAEIGDFINQPVKTYSSGMALRLAFAVVAHVDADVLIVDEALSVGDAFFTQKCMRFIRKFREEHTILFVSHDTGAVVNLCTKAILLENGRISRIGSPKDVAEYYLAQQFHANQGGNMEIVEGGDNKKEEKQEELCFRDMRQSFLVTTNLRNDIELLQFNENSNSFGTGQAKITNVVMTDEKDQLLSWVVGGEMVKIKVYAETYKDLYRPIIGFIVKDHLGQNLFAANTCITYLEKPLSMAAGQKLCCTFEFRMPILYVGDYSIMVSIAEGTQQENVQHHWLHDAFIFKSHAPEPLALMGIPMKNINMEIY